MAQDQQMALPVAAMVQVAPLTPPSPPLPTTLAGVHARSQPHLDCVA